MRLEFLTLSDSHVRDLSPQANLTEVQELYLDGTRLADVKPLVNLKNLRELYIDAPVRDAAPLLKLEHLSVLAIDNAKVRKEDFELLQRSLPSVISGPVITD